MEQPIYDQQPSPVTVCKECGRVLTPGTQFCTGCGCPVTKPESKPPVTTVVKVAVAAVLCIIAIILFIGGTSVLNSDQMGFWKDHLRTCEINRQDCQRAMYQSSGMFYSSYRDLVDSYDEMIEDAKDEIAELEAEATTQFVGAGICVVLAVVVFVVPWKRVMNRGTD